MSLAGIFDGIQLGAASAAFLVAGPKPNRSGESHMPGFLRSGAGDMINRGGAGITIQK